MAAIDGHGVATIVGGPAKFPVAELEDHGNGHDQPGATDMSRAAMIGFTIIAAPTRLRVDFRGELAAESTVPRRRLSQRRAELQDWFPL